MAKKFRSVFGTLIFFLSIAFGMHVAGQTAAPEPAPPTPAAPAGNLPPGAPSAQDIHNLLQNAGAIPAASAVTNGGTAPAFGPNALKQMEHLIPNANSQAAPPAPSVPAAPAVFVPSDVETIIPHQVKAMDPRAILHTSMGDITIRLYPAYAPKNVHAFIDLARGDREFTDVKTGRPTRRPFYTDLIFHRVLKGFLIQTGCPFGNGQGGPGFNTPDEISQTLRFDKPGVVAMAPQREGLSERKDSNGSQFFITVAPMPEWDEKFTIIGQVEKGMKVVQKIAKSRTGPTERPIKRVFLNSVEIFDETTAKAAEEGQAPAAPSNPEP